MKYDQNYVYMNEEPGDGGEPAGAEPVNNSTPVSGEGEGKWFDSLPQDMREDQNITKFESVEGMAKSWLNAQRMIGQDKIPMPQTDEDWGNVYGRLGRPDESGGYEINAPEGSTVDETMQGDFKATAHDIGLNQSQMDKLTEWYFGTASAQTEANNNASESALNDAVGSLKKDWGQAFDQNVGIAQRAIGEFLGDSDKEFLNTAVIDGVKVGDHPVMAKMFHTIGSAMMEGGKLEGLGTERAMTPNDIQDKINTLMAHPAYIDRTNPEHKQIARQVTQLFEQQSPS